MRLRIFLYIAVVLIFGCEYEGGRLVQFQQSRFDVMGTVVSISSSARNEGVARAAIVAAFEQLDRIDELMSDYKPDSELSIVNREAFDIPVAVGPELFSVLETAVKYSRLSGGAFDVTVGPVVDLWRKAGAEGTSPTDKEIAWAKAKTGYDKLLLDKNRRTVRFEYNGMRIDLGGIAKGYGIDRAVDAMKRAGAVGGLVDVGGDIRCFGKPANKPKWVIGLQDPDTESGMLLTLEIGDMAVATSGDYRRFVVVGGEQHSHIMNPAAGGSVKDFSSVTVLAKKAIDADALATAVTVLGAKEGIKLIESLSSTEALLYPSDRSEGEVYTTGFEKFVY